MAMTTAEIDALPDLTNAQELKLVNFAITQILSGAQSYTIGERAAVKARLDTLFARKAELVAAVEEEEVVTDDATGGIVLVQYGERV